MNCELILSMKQSGKTAKQIAVETGLTVSQVYNVWNGRNKLGAPRKDAGKTKYAITPDLVAQCRIMYLNQSAENNLQKVIDTVYDAMIESHVAGPSKATLRAHVDRVAKEEAWRRQFIFIKKKQLNQKFVTKSYYDRTEWGFMHWWIMDGRQSDVKVLFEDRLVYVYGYFIREARTGRVIGVAFSPEAFNARHVMRLVARTANIYGGPIIGFILDNGLEQMGAENVQAMEAMWEPEVIEDYRLHRVTEINELFPNAISPVVNSLARIPTFPMKAAIESMFRHFQSHHDAVVGRNNYIGTGRNDQVHTTLNRTPRIDQTSSTYDEFVSTFTWYLTSTGDRRPGLIPYNDEQRPKAFATFAHDTGLQPTCAAAWDYCAVSFTPRRLTAEQVFRIMIHTEERITKRITADCQITFQRDGIRRNFICPQLSFTNTGDTVDLIIDPADDDRALVIYQGSVIGIAEDIDRKRQKGLWTRGATVQIMSDIRKAKRQELQNAVADYHAKKYPHMDPVQAPGKEDQAFVFDGESNMLNTFTKNTPANDDERIDIDDEVAALARRYLVDFNQ